LAKPSQVASGPMALPFERLAVGRKTFGSFRPAPQGKAKVQALRITTLPNTNRRAVVAQFATAARGWARRGQLGSTSTSEMRGYTRARDDTETGPDEEEQS
jgi:hypothetical protein